MNAQLTPLQRAKNAVVPPGAQMRELRVGIGRGLNITLDLRHWTKLYLGLYEIELNRHIRALVRPGVTSFDVGGQNGYDALVLAKLSAAPVISFEMDPELCDAMRASFAANPDLEPLMGVRNAFVGDTTDAEAGTLALDDVAYGGDGFVPDFMKLDIEGGESAALRGASRILSERRPSLIIEVHGADVERACLEQLRAHGYTPTIVNPRRWLKDNRPIEHNRWLVAEGAIR